MNKIFFIFAFVALISSMVFAQTTTIEKSTAKYQIQLTVLEPITFPTRSPGQLAGWFLFRGKELEKLTPAQRRASFCQVMPIFIDQVTPGQIFIGDVPAGPYVDDNQIVRFGAMFRLQEDTFRGESIAIDWAKDGGRKVLLTSLASFASA